MVKLRQKRPGDQLKDKAENFYKRADGFSHGSLGILLAALKSMANARAPEAAASIAYYTLFSFFPLIIILISVGSSILEGEEAQDQLMVFVKDALPLGEDLIGENIQRLTHLSEDFPSAKELASENVRRFLELRKPVGTVALVGLLWAATSVFVVLTHNVNRAWNDAERRNFLKGRLAGLSTVIILAFLR